MPESGLLASLLLGQKRREDPLEQRIKYGQSLMTQGSSAAPVQSWGEGLARALVGGVGGIFAGQAEGDVKARETATNQKLAAALAAKTPEDLQAVLSDTKGVDSDIFAPIAAQLIGEKMADQRKAQLATRDFNALGGPQIAGGPAGAVASAPIQTPQGMPAPLPQGDTQGGAFANNLGNLRTSSAPWAGKGAPQNGFETFATPQAGANAAFQNLGAYVQANPGITVAQAITKWAPPSENDTQTYIKQVAEETGINPGMPLGEVLKDPAVAARLLDGITRKEKGGLPPGVTADTFMSATGGQPQIPQGAGPPQVAPAAPQAPAVQPQMAPAPQVQFSPEAIDLERQAQNAMKNGDPEKAAALRAKSVAAQATYLGKVEDERRRIALEGQESDRRQAGNPNAEQALSGGFADRMQVSHTIASQLAQQGTSAMQRGLDKIPGGLGNYAQSPEYQRFRQSKDDFINAQLRRESGAAINADEYIKADKQYFPAPGDDAATIAQKERNRALAIEGMIRNAGPGYRPSALVSTPATGIAPPQGAQSMPTPKTKEERDALPPGTAYTAPDGSVRTR